MIKKHIAIIGAGTAGIASAILLAKQNIQVSIFEKAENLDPVGAGLLLQPSGLAVFEHLGILEHALQLGTVVTGLEGQLANGQLLVNSHYKQANENFYGLGIHRASLCHVLESKAREFPNHIHWYMGHDVHTLNENTDDIRIKGTSSNGKFEAAFDVVIVANGARSSIRPEAWVKVNKPYPWGAKWIIVPECQELNPQILHQFYDKAQTMMGIMPTGAIPHSTNKLSSVFWSMPTEHLDSFLLDKTSQQKWLHQVHQRWSKAAEWLETVLPEENNQEKWLSANYRDVVMSKFGEGRIGVIGDAAHAMSPQLGQGANMALLDAWALGQSFQIATQKDNLDLNELWKSYHQHRQPSIRFYQFFSRLLTPLYQSHSKIAGPIRDLSFLSMYQIPYFRKEMAITISGLKSNMLQTMNYADIAKPAKDHTDFALNTLKID